MLNACDSPTLLVYSALYACLSRLHYYTIYFHLLLNCCSELWLKVLKTLLLFMCLFGGLCCLFVSYGCARVERRSVKLHIFGPLQSGKLSSIKCVLIRPCSMLVGLCKVYLACIIFLLKE